MSNPTHESIKKSIAVEKAASKEPEKRPGLSRAKVSLDGINPDQGVKIDWPALQPLMNTATSMKKWSNSSSMSDDQLAKYRASVQKDPNWNAFKKAFPVLHKTANILDASSHNARELKRAYESTSNKEKFDKAWEIAKVIGFQTGIFKFAWTKSNPTHESIKESIAVEKAVDPNDLKLPKGFYLTGKKGKDRKTGEVTYEAENSKSQRRWISESGKVTPE